MAFEENTKPLTTAAGAPVADNQNIMTAGPRGPLLLQDVWLLEKLAHFDREVIPERRMHAKGSGAYGTFTVTHDITPLHRRQRSSAEVGKKTRAVRPLLHRRRRARRGRRRARHPRLRAEVLHRGRQLGPRRQQHAGVLLARPAEVPRPQPRGQARPAHQPAQRREQLGLLDPAARGAAPGHHRHERPRHPGELPPHARLRQPHLQLHQRRQASATGSSSTSAPSRASRTSPTPKPPNVIGKDRESHQRDLFDAIETRRLPEVDAVHPGHARGRRREATASTPST